MRVAQEKVRVFYEKHGLLVNDQPTLISPEAAQHRVDLIREELQEYEEAVASGDLVAIADALADLQYVVLGTNLAHGIDAQPIFDEVHRSNMTKTPLDSVTHKGGKAEGYEKPRIAELLIIQATGLAESV